METTRAGGTKSDILEEAGKAYENLGIEVKGLGTYGIYHRLECKRCGALLGMSGDNLPAGLVPALIRDHFDLYAAGLLGCKCGYQAERARAVDPDRAREACAQLA